MTTTIYKFLFLLALVSLMGCENFFDTEIELPTPEHNPVLAINSYITSTNDSIVGVRVSRTYGLFEDSPDEERIYDATVELFENGSLLYSLEAFDESYGYNYKADLPAAFGGIGKTYELRVSHPDYGTVSATQTMPIPVPLQEVEYRPLESNDFEQPNGEVRLTFQDPAGEENYYEFLITNYCEFTIELPNGEILLDTFENSIYLDQDFNVDPNLYMGFDGTALLISDRNFDGQTITIGPQFNSYGCFDAPNLVSQGFVVYWRTVTKDYFNYSTSLRDSESAAENPFAEPVSVYSNVEGGVGAVCLRSELRYFVE
ncbi:MAG: DUF4249 domain-containing protein [Phaeodactylibacter sp.]|nr:DUF4249 domain-containing protein [Phaeodactylibacter sp.]